MCWSGTRRAAASGKHTGTAWGRTVAMGGTLMGQQHRETREWRWSAMDGAQRPLHVPVCCLGGGGRRMWIEGSWFYFAFSSHFSVFYYQTVIYTNLSFDESVLFMMVIGE